MITITDKNGKDWWCFNPKKEPMIFYSDDYHFRITILHNCDNHILLKETIDEQVKGYDDERLKL